MIKYILWDFYNVLYFPRTHELNSDLIEYIKSQNNRLEFGILTAVNTDLTDWLNTNGIKNYFEFVKNTKELGLPKTNPGIYEMVVNSLGYKPSQVLMVDDLNDNLLAASAAGLQTLRYRKTKPFAEQLAELNIRL